MGVKVAGEVEVIPHFEWKIPDYSSLDSTVGHACFFYSPSFSYFDSTWKLQMYPNGHKDSAYIALYLLKEDPKPAVEDDTFRLTLEVKKSDDTLEKVFKNSGVVTFTKHSNNWGFTSLIEKSELLEHKSVLSPLDTVTITCELQKVKKTSTLCSDQKKLQGSAECISVISELETLSSDFSQFFVSKEKCDVTVRVQDKEFQAHRAVLMARSPVFRAMFAHDTKEAQEGVVNEPDCDPDSFERFLQYLYTGELKHIQFRDAQQLYITSDKYDVQKLKSYCVMHMVQNVTAENFCEISALGDRFDDAQLISSVITFFNRNFSDIFPTEQWLNLLKTNVHFANRLLKEMGAASRVKESA